MKSTIRSLALSLGLVCFGLGSFAQADEAPAPAKEHPCAADAVRLCPGVAPGGGQWKQCLKSHKEELSSECKIKLLDAAKKREEQKMKGPQQAPVPPAGE